MISGSDFSTSATIFQKIRTHMIHMIQRPRKETIHETELRAKIDDIFADCPLHWIVDTGCSLFYSADVNR